MRVFAVVGPVGHEQWQRFAPVEATAVWIGLGFFVLFGFGLDPLGVRVSILRCELLLFWVLIHCQSRIGFRIGQMFILSFVRNLVLHFRYCLGVFTLAYFSSTIKCIHV